MRTTWIGAALLSLSIMGCASSDHSHVNIHVEPSGTFTDYSAEHPDMDALIVRVIDVSESKRAYQVVQQGIRDGGVTRTVLADAEWENSPRTQCDQLTFVIPDTDWHRSATFVGCVGLEFLEGTIVFSNGSREEVRLRREACNY